MKVPTFNEWPYLIYLLVVTQFEFLNHKGSNLPTVRQVRALVVRNVTLRISRVLLYSHFSFTLNKFISFVI
jgi:hypothetical protein